MGLFKIIAALGGGMIFLVLTVSAILGALLWPYTINSWLVWYGKVASVVWWQGALIGLIPGFGYLCVPLGIMTWIVMLFLV